MCWVVATAAYFAAVHLAGGAEEILGVYVIGIVVALLYDKKALSSGG